MLPAAAAQGTRRASAAVVSEEERRRNRKTSNRLSARKSRIKQRQRVQELTVLAERLARENEAMRAGANCAMQRCRMLEQENRMLAAHAGELCATLLLRNSQLGMLGDVVGVPLDVPGVPDHLLQLYGGGGMPMPALHLTAPPPLPLPLETIQMLLELEPDVTSWTQPSVTLPPPAQHLLAPLPLEIQMLFRGASTSIV